MARTRNMYLAFLTVLLSPMAANADPVLYDLNFDLGLDGIVTGQFVADLDLQDQTDIALFGNTNTNDFSLSFLGVVFDLGTLNARRAAGFTDFTGVAGNFTSSALAGATLFLNTCGFQQCQAEWDLGDGRSGSIITARQPGAVTRAVPEPGTLALFGFGLLGISLARRKKV